jgi:hypothetical protein
MHLQVNRSEIIKLNIPSSVQFWKNECSTKNENYTKIAFKTNQASISEISITVFICSLLHSINSLK